MGIITFKATSSGYAYDILLLSGSRSGLQCMVKIAEKFVQQKNLKFSTSPDPAKSKTKCLIFSKKGRDLENNAPIILNSDSLPCI